MRITTIVLIASLASGCMAKKVKTLEAELASREATIAELEATNQGCVVEVDTLRDELARVERKNEELAAYYEALLEEFGPRMEEGSVQLVLYPDRSVLALADEVHFSTGSASLTNAGRDTVAELAALLLRHPDRRFQVEGHTDPRPISGTYASNWELGAQRAVNVVKALIAEGVPEGQLSAATYAANAPVASNAHGEGMAQNRRITVAFQPTLEETAAHQALLERARETRTVRNAGGLEDDRVAERDER